VLRTPKHLLVKAAETHPTLIGCLVIFDTNVSTLSIFGLTGAVLVPLRRGKGWYWYGPAILGKCVTLSLGSGDVAIL
jgi:hypothetical protein